MTVILRSEATKDLRYQHLGQERGALRYREEPGTCPSQRILRSFVASLLRMTAASLLTMALDLTGSLDYHATS
jgi:hypothetical protein